MNIIKTACMVAVSFVMCVFFLEATLLIRDVRLSVRLADPGIGNFNDSTYQLAQLAKTGAATLGAEGKRLDASTEELRKTERATRTLIDFTNKSLNEPEKGLLPQTTASLVRFDQVQIAALDSINKLQPILVDAGGATKNAANLLADPSILDTLKHADASASNIQDGTANLAGATKDVKEAADYELAQIKKPVNFWYTLLKTALGLGSQGRVLFTNR